MTKPSFILPPYFQDKVTAFVEGKAVPATRLDLSYQALSDRYRTATQKGYGHADEISAYMAARLPATYGAAAYVLNQLPDAVRSALSTWLDLGAGPGTASMAALATLPGLSHITLVEQDYRMHKAAEMVWAGSDAAYPQTSVTLHQKLIGADSNLPPHDAVVLSYVLSELSVPEQALAVRHAWAQTRRVLILIVPGTPSSAADLLRHRTWLIDAGGTVMAPCPHQGPCPLQESTDWCHFSQRIPRTARHRQMKKAELGYEDEKFSYLIVSRTPDDAPSASDRIIKHPLKRKGHVIMDVCAPDATAQRRILTGKERMGYEWGDCIGG